MIALSYSRLSTFESCETKFERLYVLKDVADKDNEFTIYGTRVHEALEKYGREGEPLTEETAKHQGLVDAILAQPGDKHFEYQMALREDRAPCDWFDKHAWFRGIADVLVVSGDKAFVVDWKGLSVDTVLPTPTGFTTMGRVVVGDVLFSESGEQCRVVGKSAVKNLRCYVVYFDDKTSVVCDENHLWKLHDGAVVPVTQLHKADKVMVAAPLSLPDVQLPIDPYVLGLWLADGKHTSGEVTKPDSFVWGEVQRRGYAISHDYSEKAADGKCRVHTIKGLRTKLREAKLLGNKHIPAAYLRAGYTQRLDLLRGLMDGDGNVNPARKQCVFTTVDKNLSSQVSELLCTLGQRPLVSTVKYAGFGVTGTAYPVSFRAVGLTPFLLPRKADRVLASWGAGNSWYRRVTAVEEIESIPTQCIAVDSSDHTFLCTEKMIPTHNTGKVKDNPTQLKLFACMVMDHFPEVKYVKTAFVWLAHGEVTMQTFERTYLEDMWGTLLPRIAAVQDAVDLGVFRSKPTPLCNWCPAKDSCPDKRRR